MGALSEPVIRHLGIPDNESLVSGMSLGWADHAKIENTLVSEREKISEVARRRFLAPRILRRSFRLPKTITTFEIFVLVLGLLQDE